MFLLSGVLGSTNLYALYEVLGTWLFPKPRDVEIARDGRPLARFSLEVADNVWRRARGLMGRTRIPDQGGMLFVYRRPRPARIWMAGTPLHLDVLFVGIDGRIAKIAPGLAPGSANQADSGHPVRWVIEVNAGTVERHGIAVGDTVCVQAETANRP